MSAAPANAVCVQLTPISPSISILEFVQRLGEESPGKLCIGSLCDERDVWYTAARSVYNPIHVEHDVQQDSVCLPRLGQ